MSNVSKMGEKLANTLISHLKKSPVLNGAVGFADSAINELNSSLRRDPIPLDELVSRLSENTDQTILNIQITESLVFVGGDLVASLNSMKQDMFCLDLKLYFQDVRSKVILKEIHKDLQSSILDEKSQQELVSKKSISYEVHAPHAQ